MIFWKTFGNVLQELGTVVKNPPASGEDTRDMGLIPGLWTSAGEGNGNHSSILTWRTPQTKEPGGLQSMGSQKVGHNWAQNWSLQELLYKALQFQCFVFFFKLHWQEKIKETIKVKKKLKIVEFKTKEWN